jgi:hypothetical protein
MHWRIVYANRVIVSLFFEYTGTRSRPRIHLYKPYQTYVTRSIKVSSPTCLVSLILFQQIVVTPVQLNYNSLPPRYRNAIHLAIIRVL